MHLSSESLEDGQVNLGNVLVNSAKPIDFTWTACSCSMRLCLHFLIVVLFPSSLVGAEGGLGISNGSCSAPVGCLCLKRSVVSTRWENPQVWCSTASPATALPMASWKRTTLVHVGLLFVVVTPHNFVVDQLSNRVHQFTSSPVHSAKPA